MKDSAQRLRRRLARIVPSLMVLAMSAPLSAHAQAPAGGPPVPPPPPENPASAAAALAAAPKAELTNGVIKATVLIPDAQKGFYRGSRFDWAGVVSSLTYKGQEYYGLWFDQTAGNVRDYMFYQGKVVSGPNTATLGPAEAFDADNPPGFKEAAPGAGFLKIGVGVLKKPTDGANYNSFRTYEFVDGGKWATKVGKDRATSIHTLSNAETGYGYVYTKTVRLVPGKPQMVIEHSLKNTGAKAFSTTLFNHNFLTLGGTPSGEGFTVETPFDMVPGRPRGDAATVAGKKMTYGRALKDGEVMMVSIGGSAATAADHKFTVTNAAGAGYSVQGDKPMSSFTVWSIRPTVAAEPFVTLSAAPGETVTWSNTYTYLAPRGA